MTHGTTVDASVQFVGLDVHVETITMAISRRPGAVDGPIRFRNEPAALAKALRKLGDPSTVRVCYEAGPCGYTIYRQLTKLSIDCVVIAPSLIPKKPGDRVKTDRRDASNLARLLRSGDLTAIGVPTPAIEALRDLSRLREQAVSDLHRSRQRLIKFLVRHGITEAEQTTRWTQRYTTWVATVTVDEPPAQLVLSELRDTVTTLTTRRDRITRQLEAECTGGEAGTVIAGLQHLHGIGPIIATGIVAEVGDLGRFDSPRQLMAYAGLVPSEWSSGRTVQRGGITKTGNTHLRRLLTEAAWQGIRPYQTMPPSDDPLTQLVQRARERLYHRYWRLVKRGKSRQVAIIAVARELVGFIWGVAQVVSTTDAGARHEEVAA